MKNPTSPPSPDPFAKERARSSREALMKDAEDAWNENERLRAALRDIADNAGGASTGNDGKLFEFDASWCRQSAREALDVAEATDAAYGAL